MMHVQSVLDEMGADRDCTTLNPQGDLVVARPEAVYFYSIDGRGPCFVFEGAALCLLLRHAPMHCMAVVEQACRRSTTVTDLRALREARTVKRAQFHISMFAGQKRQLRWLQHYLASVTTSMLPGSATTTALHVYDLRNKLVAASITLQHVYFRYPPVGVTGLLLIPMRNSEGASLACRSFWHGAAWLCRLPQLCG